MNGNTSVEDMHLITFLIAKHKLTKYKHTQTYTHTQELVDFPEVERKEDTCTFITLYTCNRDWMEGYGVNQQDICIYLEKYKHIHYRIIYK